MHVIRVIPELWNSTIDPIESKNPLDKKVCMKYTADFGGTPELWEFEWKYADPLTNGGAPALPTNNPTAWHDFSGQVKPGTTLQDWITVGDEGVFGLSDHYITCRYRPKDPKVIALVGNEWSNWCKAQLFEGWIKRVLKAVNPFEQRCKDYADMASTTALNTQLSMLQQAGAPYEGILIYQVQLKLFVNTLNYARK